MIKEELTGMIHELKDVSDRLGLNISDEVIFSEASSFLRGIYANQNKPQKEIEKPTKKQVDFLTKNKIKIPNTKQEAFKIIKNKINNEN